MAVLIDAPGDIARRARDVVRLCLRLLVACLLAVVVPFGAWAQDAALAQARKTGELRIGVLKNYPPFSVLEEGGGQPAGFDVQVTTLLAQRMGLRPAYSTGALGELMARLRAGELDLIGNQLLITPDRRAEFAFSRSFASIRLVVILHEKDDRDLLMLEDFDGLKLGVLRDSAVEEQAVALLGSGVRSYDRIEQALRDVEDKRIDAAIDENLIAEYLIQTRKLRVKIGAPFSASYRIGLMLRKNDESLRTAVNDALAGVLSDGSFRAISARWFGYDVSKPTTSY